MESMKFIDAIVVIFIERGLIKMLAISEPALVKVEIEDLKTGCTYLYKGNSISDCVSYFQGLFIGTRPYKILKSKSI